MTSSVGMFQISTFLLNIESFLTNLCLAIYFSWYCMAVRDDLDLDFIYSSIQMGITGICVIVCVVALCRYLFVSFYYFSFRIWINLCCLILSYLMSKQYLETILYWLVVPIIISM